MESVETRARSLRGACLVTLSLAAGEWPLAARAKADDGETDAAQERSQAFQAVSGASKESVPGGPLLVAAYGVIWALVFLYLIRLVRLQSKAQADVARLERVLGPSANAVTGAER